MATAKKSAKRKRTTRKAELIRTQGEAWLLSPARRKRQRSK
jgi:hypothetical protein